MKMIKHHRWLGVTCRRNEGETKSTRQKLAQALALTLSTTLLAGCATSHDILSPASDNATRVTNLSIAIFWIAVFVFVVVETLLIYTIVRFRRRQGQGLPKQVAGNVPLEIAWTAFPAVVLAVVFVLTLRTLFGISYYPPNLLKQGPNDPAKAVRIRVIGHQWWWEYQYPDFNITTANEMHVPIGATIYLEIESADVIHSFWMPNLGPKMDAIPGSVNRQWFTASQAGRFLGQCSEYCGTQHAMMREIVIAEPLDTFNAWVKAQQQPIPTTYSAAGELGRVTFYAMACPACHAIDGTSAIGKVGPNLTHFGSRSTFAGAWFENTPGNLTSWLLDTQAMKPGNHMPNQNPPLGAATDLVEFLHSLK